MQHEEENQQPKEFGNKPHFTTFKKETPGSRPENGHEKKAGLPPTLPSPSQMRAKFASPAKKYSEDKNFLTLVYPDSGNAGNFSYFIQFPEMPTSEPYECAIAADKLDGKWMITRFFRGPRATEWQRQEFPVPKEIDELKIVNAVIRWVHAARECSTLPTFLAPELNRGFNSSIINHSVRPYMTSVFPKAGKVCELEGIGEFPSLDSTMECAVRADYIGGRWQITRFSRPEGSEGWEERNKYKILAPQGTTQGEIMDALGTWAYYAGRNNRGARKYDPAMRDAMHVAGLNPQALAYAMQDRKAGVPSPLGP